MTDQSPVTNSPEDVWTLRIVGGVAALVIGGLLTFLIIGPGIAKQRGVAQTKKVAAAQLRDPSSAQFRNVERHRTFVCGEINGKNGYGAYNGFVRFYGDPDSVTIDPQDNMVLMQGLPTRSELFDQSFKAYCN